MVALVACHTRWRGDGMDSQTWRVAGVSAEAGEARGAAGGRRMEEKKRLMVPQRQVFPVDQQVLIHRFLPAVTPVTPC